MNTAKKESHFFHQLNPIPYVHAPRGLYPTDFAFTQPSPQIRLHDELVLVSNQIQTAVSLGSNACKYYFTNDFARDTDLQTEVRICVELRGYTVSASDDFMEPYILIQW